jgi:hypothetical protein
MPVAILHFSDSNMAGYEWTWTFYLNRTANGRFTVSCKQMVTEESALRVPARKGLRDGADVYGALEEVVSEAGYCLDDFDAGPIASEVKKVDPSLVDQFLRGPEILEQRQEKENEVRAAERERKLLPFRNVIDEYVVCFSDIPSKYGPSQREAAKRFIEDYALDHGMLPDGVHRIRISAGMRYSGSEHDFSNLARMARRDG